MQKILNDENLSEEEKARMIAALKRAAMNARNKLLAETRKLLNEEREAVKDITADLVKLDGLAERARLLAEGKLTGPEARKAMEEIIFGLKESLNRLRTWVDTGEISGKASLLEVTGGLSNEINSAMTHALEMDVRHVEQVHEHAQ